MSEQTAFPTENHVVVFMDMHNFSIAMKANENQAIAFLQETYEKLGDVIVAFNGEIIKYIGDGILCVFPSGSENAATECAFQMRKVFSEIVKKRGLPPDTELEVGISSGDLMVGIFGHPSMRQKDVFGEAVNRAAVIGHHRGIAITEKIYVAIKDKFTTNPLPDVTLKWQDQPLKVWEVLS